MSDDDDIPEPEDAGMPGWVMTFADLMSLLMCFFVLLLSFSEMDLQKFKQVAGSMEKAFGVQRQLKVTAVPRGTSIIAQEFSPGRPDPTPLNVVRQQTVDELQEMLKIQMKKSEDSSGGDAQSIAQEMIDEIREGMLNLESGENKIVIRILENASFPSGSATLRPSFLPVVDKIAKILVQTPGEITVAGYTDDQPIQNDLFRSNFELSAARAYSVIERILTNQELNPKRVVLVGHGANRPVVDNSSFENRALNRRVELVIRQGEEFLEDADEVIEIEEDADIEKLSDLIDREVPKEVEPTFPPILEITSDGTEEYFEEGGDLGVFNEDVLYNYELDSEVELGTSADETNN